MNFRATCAAFLVAAAPLLLVAQQGVGPMPSPLPPPIAAPRDIPYPGTLSLLVDFTNVRQRILQVQETIPVSPGKLILLFPAWIPGNHAVDGPIRAMAGLEISANGERIPWQRDRVNVFAFNLAVPAGVSSLDIRFEYLAPLTPSQDREGRISFDHNIMDLGWNKVVLYPAGYFSRDINFSPAVKMPAGWKYATALTTTSRSGEEVQFATVPLNTLMDAPMYAGVNYKRFDLSPNPGDQVHLNVFADTPADLDATPQELQWHRNLTAQALALFHSHHYHHYDFLLILSSTIGGQGLEHHQSSEDVIGPHYFTDWAAGVANRDLLGHEYTHSWNGKFRRPYDLWTPNFNVPMQDDLLWVYEGLTEYWGYVLTARSGLRSPLATRDLMAAMAASFADSPGRQWRSLDDTTNQEIMSHRSPVSWPSWLRGEDYYKEGLLIWLDADTTIRKLSHGQKSLDDFAHLFYGMDNGSFVTKTFTFNDIVQAMNEVQPYDWASFFRTRAYELHPQAPEEGFTEGGYQLVYNDTPSPWMQPAAGDRPSANYGTGIGFSVSGNGHIGQVWWGSPAFKAGMAAGMQIEAIDGEAYSAVRLRQALLAAERSPAPIQLLVKRGIAFETIPLDYHGGLRIPHLQRVPGTPDRLDAILAPVH
ncbi:MAG: M61 family metallopeptidase [Terriglobales bacterium]